MTNRLQLLWLLFFNENRHRHTQPDTAPYKVKLSGRSAGIRFPLGIICIYIDPFCVLHNLVSSWAFVCHLMQTVALISITCWVSTPLCKLSKTLQWRQDNGAHTGQEMYVRSRCGADAVDMSNKLNWLKYIRVKNFALQYYALYYLNIFIYTWKCQNLQFMATGLGLFSEKERILLLKSDLFLSLSVFVKRNIPW